MIDKINPSFKGIAILISCLILGIVSKFSLNIFIIALGLIFLLSSKKFSLKDSYKTLLMLVILSFAFFMSGYKFSQSGVGGSQFVGKSSLENGLNLSTRIMAFGILGLSFSKTTDKFDLIYSLKSQLKLKEGMCFGILSAINLIPKLKKDLKRIRLSYEIRGIKTHISSLGPLLSLLIRSVRFSDTMALSMEAKGFSEQRSSYKEISLGKKDYLFLIGLPLVSIIVGFYL